jgi:hypothetical protein
MRRHQATKSKVGVALFPFLAVLICTMGVLIVLLLIMVQMARVSASEVVDDTPQIELPNAQQIAKEEFEWRYEVLEQQRDQVMKEVAQKRLELSHLEEHIRELERRAKELQATANDLGQRLAGEGSNQDATRAELEQVQQDVDAAKAALAEAQRKLAGQKASYAIIPYDGPNGTRRRPVYVECTGQGVILQPEGIVLTPSDFQGPLGPGNPLDAALRGTREYYARAGVIARGGEPYPLLVVRPSGIDAYAAARTAMGTWEDEFGYELVEESMVLKFPEPDPELAKLLTKVIADARSRQSALVAAMPSSYGRGGEGEGSGFVASPARGGFVTRDGQQSAGEAMRKGGFGHGGDTRFAEGAAPGKVAGAAPEGQSLSPVDTHQSGQVSAAVNARANKGQPTPLSKTRGENWGLPSRGSEATGVERPLRVACLPDRLILLPDRGEKRPPEIVLVDGAMADDIDALVAKIRERIEEWDMAVAGGYWKPVLNVQVAEGAEMRFAEMRVLLDGSGLEVRRVDK